MSQAGRSVSAFGIVAGLLGLTFLLIPNVVFEILQVPGTDEPWAHGAGVFVIALSVHYIMSGRADAAVFIRTSVPERIWVGAAIVGLAALWGFWSVALLAVVPLAGAAWTWFALRRPQPVPST